MNGRERLTAVFNGQIPDKVPHMELVFQLEEEAFQTQWPSHEEMAAASPKERERLLNHFLRYLGEDYRNLRLGRDPTAHQPARLLRRPGDPVGAKALWRSGDDL